jgi:protein involved in polysaccharide export with SLBB domain
VPRDQRRLPPAAGYPVPVEEDGTVTLPLVGSVPVQGITVRQARAAIRDAYLRRRLLPREKIESIFVTLLQPRAYQVLVLRQESPAFALAPEGPIPSAKRGTGFVIDLPAYENDVLHALAQTGGLPGLDDYNQVIILRDGFRSEGDRTALLQQFEALAPGCPLPTPGGCSQVIRIPLQVPCGETPPVRPEDVILRSGDVVFLEARDRDLYFTGGLLPPGTHVLPRDRDLDVVEAVAEVRGALFNGAFGGSNLVGNLIAPGIGSPSPTLLAVVRRTPNGGQVPIVVDLWVAMRDPQERILVQPGDVLVLQEQPGDALARYFYQTFLNFNIFWEAFHGKFGFGALDVSAPDRLPGRIAVETLAPPTR